MFPEQPPPQSVGIGLAGVADPAHDPPPGLVQGNLVPGILLLHLPQPPPEAPDVLLDQQPVRGEDPVADEADALRHGSDSWRAPVSSPGSGIMWLYALGRCAHEWSFAEC